jgi:GNAT superfamily N-acetyltransferase
VRIHRVTSPATYRRLRTLADRINEQESWYYAEGGDPPNYFGFVWPSSDRRALPVGFIAFTLHARHDTDSRSRAPLQVITLDLEMVFVRKSVRRRSFGLYLSAAVIQWLRACRVVPPRCPTKGVVVCYHADLHSLGGAACSRLITDEFEILMDESNARSQSWRIAEFINESEI